MVSIPSPDDNILLKGFADKLETAFKNSFNQSTARTTIVVNRKSVRKDELSIITVSYCFPMRAVDWMKPYKQRYENFLNTGNSVTDEEMLYFCIAKDLDGNFLHSLHQKMQKK